MQPTQQLTSNAVAPVKRKQALAKADKVDKKLRISPKIRHAIQMLVSGRTSRRKDAAIMAGIAPEHLYRALAKDHVNSYYQQEIKRKLLGSNTVNMAAQRLLSLMQHAESEKVSADIAQRLAVASGLLPNDKGNQQTTVNVGVSVGYVIDIS